MRIPVRNIRKGPSSKHLSIMKMFPMHGGGQDQKWIYIFLIILLENSISTRRNGIVFQPRLHFLEEMMSYPITPVNKILLNEQLD